MVVNELFVRYIGILGFNRRKVLGFQEFTQQCNVLTSSLPQQG